MILVDLHCDTATELLKTGQTLQSNNLAVDLQKARTFQHWAQVFAMFVPDDLDPMQAWRHYCRLQSVLLRNVRRYCHRIGLATDASQVKALWKQGKRAAVLSLENASLLANGLHLLPLLQQHGVRFITLTWNGDNALGSGVKGSGGDLTPFGLEAVRRMCTLGIYPDVSHLNERGFYTVAEHSTLPLIASHSNLQEVNPHPRNLTRQQFETIVKSDGLVGLNFSIHFLTKPTFESIYRNLSLMLDMGGERCVAFGSDYDGTDVDCCLSSIDKMHDLCDYLISKNVSQSVLEQIFYRNALRILGDDQT